MVNVRCQACQAKYRLLAAKRVNLLGLVLEQAEQVLPWSMIFVKKMNFCTGN